MIEGNNTISTRHSATYFAAKAAEIGCKRLGLQGWLGGEVEFNGMVLKFCADGRLMVRGARLAVDFVDGWLEIVPRV